jgi:hypothetical protein
MHSSSETHEASYGIYIHGLVLEVPYHTQDPGIGTRLLGPWFLAHPWVPVGDGVYGRLSGIGHDSREGRDDVRVLDWSPQFKPCMPRSDAMFDTVREGKVTCVRCDTQDNSRF